MDAQRAVGIVGISLTLNAAFQLVLGNGFVVSIHVCLLVEEWVKATPGSQVLHLFHSHGSARAVGLERMPM
jgi:hypothetical protein